MKKNRKPIPKIYKYRSVFLQRISDYVRHGYFFYVAGYATVTDLPSLVAHFDKLYACCADRHDRTAAKQRGGANTIFLCYVNESQDANAGHPWILLCTEGKTLFRTMERAHDARKSDLRIQLRDLELVQLPRTGQSSPSWTWRFPHAVYQAQRSLIVSLAKRSNKQALFDELERIAKTPGFAGVRAQIKKIQQLAKSLLRHQLAEGAVVYTFPKVRYVQRLPDTLVSVKPTSRSRGGTGNKQDPVSAS